VSTLVQNPPPKTVPGKQNIRRVKSAREDIDVSAEVLADGTTGDSTVQGETEYQPEGLVSDGQGGTAVFRTPGYSFENRKGLEVITALGGPVEVKFVVKIQTVYGPDADATQTSAYGRGTTPADEKAGDISLGFHESCHRTDYLNYLRTKALPTFGGKIGMTRTQYEQSAAAFGRAMEKYFTDMGQDSERRTDEVGYKKSVYHANGPRP
jgi:hypothetical protein